MSLKFDTTGVICGVGTTPGHILDYSWDTLSPFTQGYVEAMAATLAASFSVIPFYDFAFSDLAPETLARIMEDCAKHPGNDALVCTTTRQHDNGVRFWRMRHGGRCEEGFPPLTPHLGDDGKVYLRESGQ